MKKLTSVFLAVIAVLCMCCGCSGAKTTPTKVIYFIGDGMGYNHIQNTAIYYEKTLNMQNISVCGEATTYALDSPVTDSAAGGTALATGYKTNCGILGYTYENNKAKRVENLLEYSRKQLKKKVGIVTTDLVTGATPAAFSSHTGSRNNDTIIRDQQIAFAPNVLFGGAGFSYQIRVEKAGHTAVTTATELNALTGGKSIFGLFDTYDLADCVEDESTPSILQMTKKAIELLDNKKGFFLMVEGAQIDKASHLNDVELALKHVYAMDLAIAYALEYAKNDGNTLVVITADHETGGLRLATNKEQITNDLYTSGNHTGQNVPVYAYGKMAELFAGEMDNTDIAKKIREILATK